MDIKTNQTTLFNPHSSKEINTINLEHNPPLIEHALGSTHADLSSSKSESISDPGTITTTQLFTKPIVFAPNLEWNVTNVRNTVIYENTLLNIFQTLSQSPGGQALRAHSFFRSGAMVQIKLTSSPFHSGKLVFYYVPPGVSGAFRESIYAKNQYPSVYVDAGDSTTGELHIPFVLIKDFLATQNPDRFSDFGTIGVAVLNPLGIGTGGQTIVNFALSLHPQQNQIAVPVLAHNILLQAGVALPVVEAIGSALAGDVGSILSSIGTAATGVAAEKGVEKMFGMDEQKVRLNPLDIQSINANNTSSTKDLNISAPSLSNMVGLGTEHLSLYPEKTFVKHQNSSSQLDDEMDLLRIAQVPSLLAIKPWTVEQASGQLLLKLNIDPTAIPSTATATDTAILYPTYLSHVTRPFAYWRGSIDYHFTFASTQQHKGKVIVGWIPFDRNTDNVSAILNNPTVLNLSLFPNEIFDLSLNKEFSFSVPYNSETPYRITNNAPTRVVEGTNVVENSNQQQTLGTLYMLVYNRLSAPSTVTPNIEFNVYIKAGKDYQLRGLRYVTGNNYQVVNYVTLQSGINVDMESSRSGILYNQANRVGRTTNGLVDATFQDDNTEHDLNKLLSKYYPQIGLTFNLAANTKRNIKISNLPGLSQRSPRVATEADPRWQNLINHFRDIYAFWHGSLNYFAIHNSTVNTPVLLMVSHDPRQTTNTNILVPSGAENQRNDTYAPIATTTQITTNVDVSETSIYSHISNLRVNPTVEISPPYRSIYRRLYTTDNALGANDFPDFDQCAGVLDFNYSNPSTTDIPVSVLLFQSIGSDFRFKYLIPPPSLRIRVN